ncbi:MAG TPA: phosphoglucomutase/phosphomannomutase family protein [Capsulimonadaceae bacterium]|jgi:alpha-D-glucose phosphate-specific phosphoglucomutase
MLSEQPIIKFGTDGWRGIIADDFTGANVRLVTQAIAEYFTVNVHGQKPIVIVGYDNRSQSEYFAAEVAKIVAMNSLLPILSSQACSSPAVSFMVQHVQACGGIMVTASHNPPNFNGLKVKAHYGGSASPAIIKVIEDRLQCLISDQRHPKTPARVMDVVEYRDLSSDYLGHLSTLVDLRQIATANLRIVVDSMHGSGAGYLSSLLRQGGCENVIEIRGDRNPSFGGVNPEPIEQNMAALSEAVVHAGAHIGIALDGDADRLGAVDSEGNFVDCHRIFAVLLRHLVEHRHWTGSVVKTVSTTRMIDRLAELYGLRLHETPIGFKHICDLMLAGDVLIGGEESGGIGVKNHIPERDGVLMGLLLLEVMATRNLKLESLISEIMTDVGHHEYARIDLHPDAVRMPNIRTMLSTVHLTQMAGREILEISNLDGTKFNFDDGSWLLVRPSGTEPVVRVYAECPTRAGVNALLDAGVDLVKHA